MKKTLLPALAAGLIGLTSLTVSAGAEASTAAPQPTPPGALHPVVRARHPALRAAIGALERAKAEMQAAAHDYGGHRVEAIAACDAAISQLRLALQYAGRQATTTAPTP